MANFVRMIAGLTPPHAELSCAIHFTHMSKNRRDHRYAGFRISITSCEVAQRPVAGFKGDAGCVPHEAVRLA
ncbi:hypothetical protein [Bradyrhizobium sp. SSUT77]|uniref:hypothetical protein n=1 Tax=Bradyrhizobium sp. SSUT77 TaxID=3040603 RepID=UPI00244AB0D2|nr:hypothetical protein [Bradyrhizobium sp. SSUT77]MDH2343123.1 hypothetical protein [Bradyrhizobium sp. SSUT77]